MHLKFDKARGLFMLEENMVKMLRFALNQEIYIDNREG